MSKSYNTNFIDMKGCISTQSWMYKKKKQNNSVNSSLCITVHVLSKFIEVSHREKSWNIGMFGVMPFVELLVQL